MNRRLILFIATPIVMSWELANAAPVYNQPLLWQTNGDNPGAAWTSHVSSSTTGFRTFDSFSVGTSTSINQATWFGMYLSGTNPYSNGSPNTTSWDIDIFSNIAGLPGVAISTTSLGSAQVTRQTIGTALFTGNSITLYSFTANITNFNAIGGVTYWFSPFSHTSNFDPLFAWVAGTGTVDDSSFQQQFVNGSISGTFTRQQDRAYSLSSTVPEPVTNMLLGFALVALAIMHQRYRPLRTGTPAAKGEQFQKR